MPHSFATLLQSLLLVALPEGGQRTARRNAWKGMADGAARARAHREAQAALVAAAAHDRLRTGT